MTANRRHNYNDRTPALTPSQRARAAVAVLCDGVDAMVVAGLYGTNVGRVQEAVNAVRAAIDPADMGNTADAQSIKTYDPALVTKAINQHPSLPPTQPMLNQPVTKN